MTASVTVADPARDADRAAGPHLVGLLLVRLVLFAAAQAVIAVLLAVAGAEDPWAASAAWWPLAASAANIVNLALLSRLLRRDGSSLRELYRFRRDSRRGDLLLALITVVIAVPIATLPNLALGTWLFGDPQVAFDMFVRPLPLGAVIAAVVLFPITTAMAELPTYYGYVQPRLAQLTRATGLVVLVPAMAHAVQHAALPLILDPEFIVWRALMFLPFALLVSIVVRRRPSVLPYLLVVHFLLDLQAAVLVPVA